MRIGWWGVFCAKRGKFVYRREGGRGGAGGGGGGGGGGEGVGGWVEESGIINPFYPTTQPGQMTQTSVQVFSHALTYLRFQLKPLWNDS